VIGNEIWKQISIWFTVLVEIKELHTHELPDIIAIPVIKGYKKFLQYIRDETS